MLNLAEASTTNDKQSVNAGASQTPITQSTTSCLHLRNKKLMWIIFSVILVILIILGITIPTIIITKKGNTITTTTAATTTEQIHPSINITPNTKWKQNATTIAGGYGEGELSYHLSFPSGLYIDDDDQSIYIADFDSWRVVQWKYNSGNGQVVAGGKGRGNQTNQLKGPTDVVIDKSPNESIIICDRENKRIVRWPRRNGRNGQTIIPNIVCFGLTMDNDGDLYIADFGNHAVKRWRQGDSKPTTIAGENGRGNNSNQLYWPTYIYVDQNYSVYISDQFNHRVMKWMKGAKEGIIVAGGHGQGDHITQLNHPHGVIVDHLGNVYVADYENDRIMRWLEGAREGTIVVGGNGKGKKPNQLSFPRDISFDERNSLYVVDAGSDRVQKFDIDSN